MPLQCPTKQLRETRPLLLGLQWPTVCIVSILLCAVTSINVFFFRLYAKEKRLIHRSFALSAPITFSDRSPKVNLPIHIPLLPSGEQLHLHTRTSLTVG